MGSIAARRPAPDDALAGVPPGHSPSPDARPGPRRSIGSSHRPSSRPEPPGGGAPDDLDDLRFRALVGHAAWARLPAAVRARFGRRLAPGATITYVGTVDACRASLAGRCLAQTLRLVGGPLPVSTDTGVPASVAVTEDEAAGGQFWTRMYGRRRGFPAIVHSSKRFSGPTGLEEYVGCGIGVALSVTADARALHFDGDHYFLDVARCRVRLPRWMSPGALRVSHVDVDGERFEFALRLVHPLLGTLIEQRATFVERR